MKHVSTSRILTTCLSVRVYSPSTLLDASRTRNVPSGVFLITSFTSCLGEAWREMLTTCQNADLMLQRFWSHEMPTVLNLWPYVKALYTLKCFPSTTPHVTDGCHQSRSYTPPSRQSNRYCVELLTTEVPRQLHEFCNRESVSHWNTDHFRVMSFLVPCSNCVFIKATFGSKSARKKIGHVGPVACWTKMEKQSSEIPCSLVMSVAGEARASSRSPGDEASCRFAIRVLDWASPLFWLISGSRNSAMRTARATSYQTRCWPTRLGRTTALDVVLFLILIHHVRTRLLTDDTGRLPQIPERALLNTRAYSPELSAA